MQYLLLNQLLTKSKEVHGLLNEETTYLLYYYYKIIITMIRRKAIFGTRFPYPYCCKSANTSCNVIAACSSERPQPLAVVVVVVDNLVTHAHIDYPLAVFRKEGKCDKASQSGLLWKMNFQSGVYMHVYFNRAPGYGSICRVN